MFTSWAQVNKCKPKVQRGCEALNHTVDGWMQQHPTDHVLSDDLIAMYNMVELPAAFSAMRKYQPELVPSTRLVYASKA